MKLTIIYETTTKGYDSKAHLDIDLDKPNEAIALGYAAMTVRAVANQLDELCNTCHPRHAEDVTLGMALACKQKMEEENPHWPFTTRIETDET